MKSSEVAVKYVNETGQKMKGLEIPLGAVAVSWAILTAALVIVEAIREKS